MSNKQNQSRWLVLLGQFLYVAMLMALLMLYLYFFCDNIYNNQEGVHIHLQSYSALLPRRHRP